MLLQTNSYVVPKEKRVEHARLVRRFKQALSRLGCDQFEVYEQVGTNWTSDQTSGRFVQILRFRDRRQQLAVQAAERSDPACQAIIAEFCDLINYPYQQQQGLFAIGYYSSVLSPAKALPHEPAAGDNGAAVAAASEAAQPAPPTAQEIQFGDMPVQAVAAEELVEQESAAESSLVVDAEPAGTNGDAAHETGAPTEGGAESLDELIKRRFGSVEITDSVEVADTSITPPGDSNGEHVSPPPAGSGIGEVLNAVGDDDDFDFLLPGEPLEADSGKNGAVDSERAEPDTAQH